MNLNFIDLTVIAFYFLGLIAFGIFVRKIRGFGDYALGGRSVPFSMIFVSLSATYIGPGYTMGFAGKGFASGWLFFFVALAFSLQTVITALFIAPRLQGFQKCYTIGDIIGQQHGKAAHLISGVISTVLCVGLAAIMAKVGGLVIHSTTGLPIPVGIAIITGVGIIYCYTGGLKSVIATEALQFAIFAIAVPLMLWIAVSKSGVDLAAADAKGWESMKTTLGGMSVWQVVGLFVSFFLGETLIPPYANRALASHSAGTARSGFLAGAGYSVIWFAIVVGLGVVAAQAIPEATGDDAFMTLAIKFLPHGLLGLLVIAVAAIIMSSQESMLNAAAVSVTRDMRDVFSPSSSDDPRRLRFSRIATLVFGLLSVVFALYAPTIIDGLLIFYSIWAPSVLPVLVLAVLIKTPPSRAGAPAMIAGAASSLIWQFWLNEPSSIPAVIVGLAANLLVYFGFTVATRKA